MAAGLRGGGAKRSRYIDNGRSFPDIVTCLVSSTAISLVQAAVLYRLDQWQQPAGSSPCLLLPPSCRSQRPVKICVTALLKPLAPRGSKCHSLGLQGRAPRAPILSGRLCGCFLLQPLPYLLVSWLLLAEGLRTCGLSLLGTRAPAQLLPLFPQTSVQLSPCLRRVPPPTCQEQPRPGSGACRRPPPVSSFTFPLALRFICRTMCFTCCLSVCLPHSLHAPWGQGYLSGMVTAVTPGLEQGT